MGFVVAALGLVFKGIFLLVQTVFIAVLVVAIALWVLAWLAGQVGVGPMSDSYKGREPEDDDRH